MLLFKDQKDFNAYLRHKEKQTKRREFSKKQYELNPDRKLLTAPQSNPKVAKNEKLNILSSVLHLAPSDLSGFNTCPKASQGCKAACLNTAGRGGIFQESDLSFDGMQWNAIQKARVAKTYMFYMHRDLFFEKLCKEIEALIIKAAKIGFKPAIRLNGTSDISFEAYKFKRNSITYDNIFAAFPEVQFYDYTAIYKRAIKCNAIDNYHLTFSRKEDNDNEVLEALKLGLNIAAVFKDKLPKTYLGYEVINGDYTDYRPADSIGKNKPVIVGLIAKGKAKKDNSGFTIVMGDK